MLAAPLFARLAARFGIACAEEVGPIPKLGGHTCRCNRLTPHRLPHACDCGSWFEPRADKVAS